MLIIKVQKGNLNRALKQFKRKFKNTKVLKEIRERKHYVKPSLKIKIAATILAIGWLFFIIAVGSEPIR